MAGGLTVRFYYTVTSAPSKKPPLSSKACQQRSDRAPPRPSRGPTGFTHFRRGRSNGATNSSSPSALSRGSRAGARTVALDARVKPGPDSLGGGQRVAGFSGHPQIGGASGRERGLQ